MERFEGCAVLGASETSEPGGWERTALEARPRLVSIAFRVVRDGGDAEDAADEAIARLARERRAGVRFSDPEAWLVRTTLRLALDRARHFVRRVRKLRDLHARRREAPDPGDEAHRAELREEIWREILTLSEKRREVLVLRDMEGLAFAEIARILGIGESTARAHVYAAREKLRRKLRRFRRDP